MADNSTDSDGGSHWFRWLLLIAIAIGLISAGRRWALSKADAEFEERLQRADEQRN